MTILYEMPEGPVKFCDKCILQVTKIPIIGTTLAQALMPQPGGIPELTPEPNLLAFAILYGRLAIVALVCESQCQQEPSQPPRVAPLIIVDPATNTVTIFKPINETAQESVDQSLPETVTENAAQFSSKTIQEQITENLNITTFFS